MSKLNNDDVLKILNRNLMIYVNSTNLTVINRKKNIEPIFNKKNIKINYIEGPTIEDCKKNSMINVDILKKNNRGNGVMGLIGSYIKCLEYGINNNLDSLIIFEDDCLPINSDNYIDEIRFALSLLPVDWMEKSMILDFGSTIYCNNSSNYKENTWIKKPQLWQGAHAILYTKKSLNNLYNYIKNNKISVALDEFIKNIHQKIEVENLVYTGTVSKSKMFRGIFEQFETYCDKRNSVINILKENYIDITSTINNKGIGIL
jgi:hypothetical protein